MVGFTSMYSVISGKRLNLLSLGPILNSAMRSIASVRYGARNFSGCSSSGVVLGVGGRSAIRWSSNQRAIITPLIYICVWVRGDNQSTTMYMLIDPNRPYNPFLRFPEPEKLI